MRVRTGVGMMALLLSMPVTSVGQDRGNPPTRLALQVGAKTAPIGSSVSVRIELRDAYNLPAVSAESYGILIEVLADKAGPALWKTKLTLEGEKGFRETRVCLPRIGILMIKASHPALRESAAFVSVSARPDEGSPTCGQTQAPRGSVQPVAWRPRLRITQIPPSAPDSLPPRTLTLRYSHEGTRLTANGADADVIDAFLSEAAPTAIQVTLWASSGRLRPNPIVIAAGDVSASAELTTTQAGLTTIAVQSVVPADAATHVGDRSVRARFWIPIKELHLALSPSQLTLGSATEIQLSMLGLDGTPVASDENREIQVAVDKGGALELSHFVLEAGHLFERSRFTPQATGEYAFTASAKGAATRRAATLRVDWPATALFALLVSGLAGGLLRAGRTLIRRDAGWRSKALIELLGGPIVAFVGFAASLFGLLPRIGVSIVTNAIGAAFVGVLAAYCGATLLGAMAKLVFPLPGVGDDPTSVAPAAGPGGGPGS